MAEINDNFLLELFSLCFKRRNVLDICCKYLGFHHLQKESHKFIWKALKTYYQTTFKIPTIGFISQQFSSKIEILEELNKIKEIGDIDEEDILKQLDLFFKDLYFIEIYDKFYNLYINGEKEKVYNLIKEAGDYFINFSIKKDSLIFEKVFDIDNYEQREKERFDNSQQNYNQYKQPFFIDEVDEMLFGGVDKGDTWLGLSQSGVGKSKFLKYVGVNLARIGRRVLHIQAEGSKKECMDLYDATWSGQTIHEIEAGVVSEELKLKLKKAIKGINLNKGEIYVYAAEKFDSISMRDIRNLALEIIKLYGSLDTILIDYFEEVEPGDGRVYKVGEERQRREAISKDMKNLAVELNVAVGSMTQASTVEPEKLEDPNFVMTRYDISEFKGALKPFSLFFTFNQTSDEYDAQILRIFWDKIRKYKGKKIITIAQAYEYERFYDRKRTKDLFYKKSKEEKSN